MKHETIEPYDRKKWTNLQLNKMNHLTNANQQSTLKCKQLREFCEYCLDSIHCTADSVIVNEYKSDKLRQTKFRWWTTNDFSQKEMHKIRLQKDKIRYRIEKMRIHISVIPKKKSEWKYWRRKEQICHEIRTNCLKASCAPHSLNCDLDNVQGRTLIFNETQ